MGLKEYVIIGIILLIIIGVLAEHLIDKYFQRKSEYANKLAEKIKELKNGKI